MTSFSGYRNGHDRSASWQNHGGTPDTVEWLETYRHAANADYRAAGSRVSTEADDDGGEDEPGQIRSAAKFSIEDVERILQASGVQYRHMAVGHADVADRSWRLWRAPLVRKIARILYVKGGEMIFWSGFVVLGSMVVYRSIEALLH